MAILPSIRSYTLVVGGAMRMPLARPAELMRRNTITRLLSTSSTPSSSSRKSGAASSTSVRKRLMLAPRRKPAVRRRKPRIVSVR
jgi:hypothetical protein